MHSHECRGLWRSVRSPGAGVTGNCDIQVRHWCVGEVSGFLLLLLLWFFFPRSLDPEPRPSEERELQLRKFVHMVSLQVWGIFLIDD